MQQQENFNIWLDECRNYGLRVTRDRLIKSLYEFDDFTYLNRPVLRGGQLV
jgi:hypothetical protein